jgi:predicted CXXCH cytochrome family protein
MKIFLIGLLIIILVVIGYALYESPHDFSVEECKGCHKGVPQKGQKSPLPMIGKIRTLCSRCHSNIVRTYSHPDEVLPVNTRVPADMPLSVEKKVTCATCHDIHSTAEWSKKVHLLRRTVTGIEFCSVCHEEQPTELSHAKTLGYAHSAGARYVPRDKSGSLDRLSIQCISCHDSSIGRGDSIGSSGFWLHSKDLARHLNGHPIGVSYDEAQYKDPGGYKEKSILSPVKLFSGKVGCGSCHDPYSSIPNRLVISNEGSALCYKCHNM